MSDINNIHKLLIESVEEENQKNNELSDSIFQLNSKKNLIAIARETLKTKNNKYNKIKNPVLKEKPQEKSPKMKIKYKKKIIKPNEDIKTEVIFSDQEYLNFMLDDLRYISTLIEKKERRYRPTLPNNSPLRNNQSNVLSFDNKNQNNRKTLNHKKMDEHKFNTRNYNNVNLLNQIIGVQEINEPNYENKVTITEDNVVFNNLYFDKNTNKLFYQEKKNNL